MPKGFKGFQKGHSFYGNLSKPNYFQKGHKGHWIDKKRPNISGKNHYNWKGGRSRYCRFGYYTPRYIKWRTEIFTRDNYTCIWCGIKSGNGKAVILNADHIKPFSLFPELRFAIDNGRTLCIDCHKTTDTYAGKISKVKDNLYTIFRL